MKKGFTLIELIAVLAVLSIIGIVLMVAITKRMQNVEIKIDDATKEVIFASTRSYINKHANNYPLTDGSTYCVAIESLIVNGDLKYNQIKNTELNASSYVRVGVINDDYSYQVVSTCTYGMVTDLTGPVNVNVVEVAKTATSLTITTNAIDLESGINKYEFSIDGGSYIDNSNNSIYTFNPITEGIHTIKIRVTNVDGVMTESGTASISTVIVNNPTFVINPSGYAASKIVTISYPTGTGLTYKYSKNGGSWTNASQSQAVTFTGNGNIVARVIKDNIILASASYNVTGIDTTVPVFTNQIVTVRQQKKSLIAMYSGAIDPESGIKNYTCYYGTTSNPTTLGSASGTTCTFSNLTDNTKYYFKICATNGVNKVACSNVSSKTTLQTVFTYEYTGSTQTFTAPSKGTYKIELWGASGNYSFVGASSTATTAGGLGAYVSGNIELSENYKLYIYVGEKGAETISTTAWNGGGASYASAYPDDQTRGGGGATDVRILAGNWNNSSSLNSRIMVAGAGGGATDYVNGGYGGGIISMWASGNSLFTDATQMTGGYNSGSNTYGVQSIGGFGTGGTGIFGAGSGHYGGAGGGSGYYGGFGGYTNYSGGGGSSFISGHTGCVAVNSGGSAISGCTSQTTDNACSIHYSNKVFDNTKMIDGAGYAWTNTRGSLERMPKPTGGYYESGVGHSGNGYVRITLIEIANEVEPGTVTNLTYTGSAQTFTAPASGTYKIELWGAQGGAINNGIVSGQGGYSSGKIYLSIGETIYAYIGQAGYAGSGRYSPLPTAFNGGGNVGASTFNNTYRSPGGGATDIRLDTSLYSRIMVAGAGGGAPNEYYNPTTLSYNLGGVGGGLIGGNGSEGFYVGYSGTTASGFGGTQTESATINGSFGVGGNAPSARTAGGGGGGGYFGGGAGYGGFANGIGGGGGSSFISGHTGCVAVNSSGPLRAGCTTGTTDQKCSIHSSNKVFTDTIMIDGAGYSWTNYKKGQVQMPNPNGGYYELGVGHSGDGRVRITYEG